ncbi:L,D-transpeptidase [Sphingomonas radiodurans]|uniref:L,D-transpeptidase n=1 Tax=Sphingomonas radiodurans TaxID=2890321 RepID=UPI001E46EA2D|nr:L,D-transpeptidase [Sphingomonas radiodurans]WBH17847.1 L,D-transpeptidase [Sphingomonas radiodurans]
MTMALLGCRTPALAALALAVMSLPSLASAQAAPAADPTVLPITTADGRIERLKPGEYLWAPGIAPAGPVTIIVSLKTQRAYVYRNGVPIGVTTVSTGRKGHVTPTGVFTVLQKDADHVSNLYEDAAMPFMQRLTWGGIAMHAGNLPGYPASHGCIRMPLAFAKLLFGITRMGITVVITDDALVPVVVAGPSPLGRNIAPTAPGAAFAWNPARAPTGPVSIVVSGRDRRVIVLRNGVEIGSSPIALDAPIDRTAAFTLQSIDEAGEHWLSLPLPGETGSREIGPEDRAKARLPDGFHAALSTILTPGATLLVTRDTLATSGTGTAVTIIETDH